MQMANSILNEFKGHNEAWMCVDSILVNAQSPQTKFFGLQILDEAVNTRWNVLGKENKLGIRNVLVQLVLNFPEQDRAGQLFLLTKLNGTLISIVKQEWNTTWTNFIPDICTSAKESENKCENALNILRLLSEEVFDFSKGQVLSKEVTILKTAMTEQFSMIY